MMLYKKVYLTFVVLLDLRKVRSETEQAENKFIIS